MMMSQKQHESQQDILNSVVKYLKNNLLGLPAIRALYKKLGMQQQSHKYKYLKVHTYIFALAVCIG